VFRFVLLFWRINLKLIYRHVAFGFWGGACQRLYSKRQITSTWLELNRLMSVSVYCDSQQLLCSVFFKLFRRVLRWSFRVSTRFSLLCLILLTDFHKTASFNTPNYLNTTFTFGKKIKTILWIESFSVHIHSFIHSFPCPLFLWGGSRGQQLYVDPKYPTVNSSLRKFPSVHTKTGPSKVGDVVTLPGPWTSRLLSHRCSQQDLSRKSFLGDSGNMAEPLRWDLSNRKSGMTFRALRISNLCILPRSVTPWTLRKNPISAACSWESIPLVVTRGSGLQTRIETKSDLKTERFAIFESSCFHHGTTKLT